jgi:hypothetical protein
VKKEKLKRCIICNGNIWTDDHREYSLYTDYFINMHLAVGEKPKDTRNKVYVLPIWEWKSKGFFSSSEPTLIKNIRICERCFIISGWNDGFIKRDSNGTWFTDYYRGAFHAVENLMEEWKSIKSMATNLGSNKYQPDELLHRLLKKIDENKKEQKTIVQDFAQRESGKLKKDKAKKEKKIKAADVRTDKIKKSIKKLLKDRSIKMPASDIDAHLKHKNVDEIKELCEKMYISGEISRTGNYRYFILSEEKKKPKPKKTSASKSEEVDVEKELEKLKGLLDKGLITQEQYDAKSNELLGL